MATGAIVDGLLAGWNVGLWRVGAVTDDGWVALAGWLAGSAADGN